MKRFLLVLTVLVVLLCLLVPTIALATTPGEPPSVEAMAAFMLPYAFLVPVVVSVVNSVNRQMNGHGTTLLKASVGVTTAVLGAVVFRYFLVMPEALRVAMVGLVVWLSASGVFDLFKMLKPQTDR